MSDTKKPRILKAKNTLKEKVGEGGFNAEDIEKAQEALDNTKIDFAPEAHKLIAELNDAIGKIKSDTFDSPKEAMQTVLTPILQLKAQGGMFNYPSISSISSDIMMFLEDVKSVDDDLVKILKSFYQSVKVLLDMEIKSASHQVAVQLRAEFKAVCSRYLKKKG